MLEIRQFAQENLAIFGLKFYQKSDDPFCKYHINYLYREISWLLGRTVAMFKFGMLRPKKS